MDGPIVVGYEDAVPGLVVDDEDPAAVRAALAQALESAVETDVRSGGVREVAEIPFTEETPLLRAPAQNKGRWSNWFASRKGE